MLFPESFEFGKRIRHTFLKRERENLNVTGLELLPDLVF